MQNDDHHLRNVQETLRCDNGRVNGDCRIKGNRDCLSQVERTQGEAMASTYVPKVRWTDETGGRDNHVGLSLTSPANVPS
jgi:hypothetical protein